MILVVALLIFGPAKLPELARSLGRGLAEFRRASNDLRQSIMTDFDPAAPPRPQPGAGGGPADQMAQAPLPSGEAKPPPDAPASDAVPDPTSAPGDALSSGPTNERASEPVLPQPPADKKPD